MSRPYSNITQSARLRPALDRYIEYLSGTRTRTSRLGTQGARQATLAVYLTPFGFDVATGVKLQAMVNPDHYSVLAPVINAAATEAEVTVTAPTNAEKRTGFKAARIVVFTNSTRSVTTPTSDITGLQYLKYAGTRRSCPFGRKAADADMFDAFNAMKRAYLEANASLAVKRVSLQRENYSYK